MSYPVLSCPECDVEQGISTVTVDAEADEDGMHDVEEALLECGHITEDADMRLSTGVVHLLQMDRPDVIEVADAGADA